MKQLSDVRLTRFPGVTGGKDLWKLTIEGSAIDDDGSTTHFKIEFKTFDLQEALQHLVRKVASYQ